MPALVARSLRYSVAVLAWPVCLLRSRLLAPLQSEPQLFPMTQIMALS